MANPILNLGNNEWATKSESLLGYNKSGSNFKPVPFTHSRASIGTTIDRNGVLQTEAGNIPRIDFKDNIKGSLLLEPQRTNLQVRSEEFDNASWSKSNVNVSANSETSPSGSLNADKIIANTTSGAHYVQGSVSGLSTSSEATFSVFVKKDEITQLQLLCAQNSSPYTNWARLQFDLNTLSEFSTNVGTFGYEEYPNGWVKVFITGIPTSTSALIRVSLYKNFSNAFSGNNIDGFYLFGAQVEQGSYPTSYIPTGASTVTRLKDECFNGGNADLFNITEGTLFIDILPFVGNYSIGLSNGTDSQKIVLIFYSYGQIRTYSSGGVSDFNSISFNQRNKIAVSFKNNEYKTYINGTLASTDTSATIPTGMNRLNFSNRTNTANYAEGEINQTLVFNEALSDSELQTLTTL